MEAKRMRFCANNTPEKLDLKIWQNLILSKCYEDNYINRLLESTRSFLVASEELSVEQEAISTAIDTFGLKQTPSYDMFGDNTSDSSNLPSTSSPSTSRQHSSSSSSSTDTLTLESEAINSAISSYGLNVHKN